MKNNIHLIIGENAVGKTRFLKKKCEEYRGCITNIPKYESPIGLSLDAKKVNSIEEFDDNLGEMIYTNETNINKQYLKRLFNMICAEGEYLILDELDVNLERQSIIDIAQSIHATKDFWTEIYVSGYNSRLLELFPDRNELSVYRIDGDGNAVKLIGGNIYECFNSL